MSFASELRHVSRASSTPGQSPAARAPSEIRRALPVPTPHPFAKAFACAAIAYGLATAILLGVATPTGLPDATAIGRALSIFASASFVPALITGMVVCQSPRVWPFWRIALTFTPMFALVAALHTTGAAAG